MTIIHQILQYANDIHEVQLGIFTKLEKKEENVLPFMRTPQMFLRPLTLRWHSQIIAALLIPYEARFTPSQPNEGHPHPHRGIFIYPTM